jgi:mRNA-degrading endonuclease toxin of MazEF toxin-antitoxin module
LRVRLSKGEGGVARDSDVMLDQMCAMDNGRFRRRMGQIPGEKMEELRTKLVSLLDLV